MFQKVKPYAGEYGKYTTWAVFCVSAAVIFSVIPYFLLYRLIVPLTLGESPRWSSVLFYILLIGLCMAANALLYIQGLNLSHFSAYHILKNIRISLQKRLESQPLGNIRDLGNGRIKKLFTDDIDTLELLLAHAIPEGIGNLIISFFVILAMFFMDWKLALLSILSLPLGIFAMGMMFATGTSRMGEYYAAGTKMNNTIIEYINGMEVVKIFNRDGESYARFEKDINYFRDMTLDWYRVCWPWMAMYTSLLPCVCLFTLPIGGYMVLRGYSALPNFILILCMSFAVGAPLFRALSFAGRIPQLQYKLEELERVISHPPLRQGTKGFCGKDHSIAFQDVTFGYVDDTPVLKNIDLEIKEGEVTALVGESGSGKSTLAKLIVHFYDVDSGTIALGGQSLEDMTLASLNDQVSYVSQEQFLFNTTLYENILLGKPEASRQEVLHAASLAQCDTFLARFPKGIDTMAGEGGKMLSGGERQRISLARAILKDAPVIVLDEATAFVDPENEEKMNAAISQVIRGKTVVVIAHRLHTIQEADHIVVLKEGQIESQGNHRELLEMSQVYPALWQAAKESISWEVRA